MSLPRAEIDRVRRPVQGAAGAVLDRTRSGVGPPVNSLGHWDGWTAETGRAAAEDRFALGRDRFMRLPHGDAADSAQPLMMFRAQLDVEGRQVRVQYGSSTRRASTPPAWNA
ncbi:hypothetical protein ETD83_35335 [Actinomadura soli]|uniref:Uncharacterized protein n=1 Tax=Actinomadura soli TaxID=2508997 RepID=A0A5C4J1A2_9ACTN|nr:hypothetical protein ETD83_35335 [Actinomadura soli]